MITVIVISLKEKTAAPWSPWPVLSNPLYAKVVWFTTWQAAASTLLCLATALPAAYVYARYSFPGKRILFALVSVPFVLPSVVVASGFKAFLGEQGLVNEALCALLHRDSPVVRMEHSIWLILLAHVFYNHPVVTRIVGGFWSRIPPSMGEAASTLGASPARVFLHVTLPMLAPSVIAASMLVFTFCFSSFGVILILGGPRFSTIEVEIYRQALHLFNLKAAAVLSLMQIAFSLTFLWIHSLLMRRASLRFEPYPVRLAQKGVCSAKEWCIVGFTLVAIALILLAPMAALATRSVLGSRGFTLEFYRTLLMGAHENLAGVEPVASILLSVGFACTALVLSLLVALPAAVYVSRPRGKVFRALDPVLMLPMATSAVTLGLGFVVAFDKGPLNLRTSAALVPLAHTLVAYPFVLRSILPALRSIPRNLKDAALTLGAPPSRVFTSIVLPLLRSPIVAGAVFAFTMSLGEFGATLFVARPSTPTMTLAIYRFLSLPGEMNYGCAMAMSTILMALTAAGFFLLERMRISTEGEI